MQLISKAPALVLGAAVVLGACQPTTPENEAPAEPIQPSIGAPASNEGRADQESGPSARVALPNIRQEEDSDAEDTHGRLADQRATDSPALKNMPVRPVFASQETLRAHSDQWLKNHAVDELVSMQPGTGLRSRFDVAPEGVLILAGIHSLNAAEAKAIADFDGAAVVLPNLTGLAPEVAAQLATWSVSEISLEGLQSITPDATRELARWGGGELYLNGLTDLNDQSARFLAEWTGQELHLDGLETCGNIAVRNLMRWEGQRLHLGRMPWLNAEKARDISGWSGDPVDFSELETLNADTAEALSILDLNLDGLTELDVETATALTNSRSTLSLNGLQELTPDVARALAGWRFGSTLSVRGHGMTVEAARNLVAWKGTELTITGVAELSPKIGVQLGSWQPEFPSSGRLKVEAREISPQAAKGLAKWEGRTLVLDLDRLGGSTARALAGFSGSMLKIEGLDRLSPDAARGLARWKGNWLFLSAVALDAGVARALAQSLAGSMSLPRLKGLSDRSARELAKWDGRILRLVNLQQVSDTAARVLSERKGKTFCRDCDQPAR